MVKNMDKDWTWALRIINMDYVELQKMATEILNDRKKKMFRR